MEHTQEAQELLKRLRTVQGDFVIAGQHTQTRKQEELVYIEEHTGELPAICGFELLAYSNNIRREDASKACLDEVDANKDTLSLAYEWGKKGGIVTFTWHWFSPLYGRDKAFYTEHTPFNPEQVLIEGTPEREAFYKDMDDMATLLMGFKEAGIPILWRPFHESEGTWFWWGSKGPEVAKKLYQAMYDYYHDVHPLNHLIWVWNSPLQEGYVGDDYCDILSVDLYPKAYTHISHQEAYENLRGFSSKKDLFALAEIGVLPDVESIIKNKIPWSWYMTWSNEFTLSQDYNCIETLQALYHNPKVLTLQRWTQLWENSIH